MGKLYLAIVFAALFIVSITAIAIAENETNTSNGTAIINGSIIDNSTNDTGNMTFGRCVEESAKIRQGCYSEIKDVSKQCASAAKLGKDKTKAKQCVSDYKNSLKDCKTEFKDAKKTCMQIYKPRFWEKFRYAFK